MLINALLIVIMVLSFLSLTRQIGRKVRPLVKVHIYENNEWREEERECSESHGKVS